MSELTGFPPQVQQQCCQFIARLRRRQLTASQDIARKTGEILRMLIATQSGKDVSQLIDSIKRAGAVLIAAQPHELVVGNMVSCTASQGQSTYSQQALPAPGEASAGNHSRGNCWFARLA